MNQRAADTAPNVANYKVPLSQVVGWMGGGVFKKVGLTSQA